MTVQRIALRLLMQLWLLRILLMLLLLLLRRRRQQQQQRFGVAVQTRTFGQQHMSKFKEEEEGEGWQRMVSAHTNTHAHAQAAAGTCVAGDHTRWRTRASPHSVANAAGWNRHSVSCLFTLATPQGPPFLVAFL